MCRDDDEFTVERPVENEIIVGLEESSKLTIVGFDCALDCHRARESVSTISPEPAPELVLAFGG